MSLSKQHITLPLEPLFDQLEKAGFDLSPAARVRAWRVLATIGRDPALRDPAELKFLLAPVFARSAEEQNRFYEVFDRYVADFNFKPDDDPRKKEKQKIFPLPGKKQALLALGLLCLLLAGYVYWRKYNDKPPALPNPFFYPDQSAYAPGEPVECVNETDFSGLDSAEYAFSWRLARQNLLDSAGGAAEIVLRSDTGRVWRFPAPEPGKGLQYEVLLIARYKDGRRTPSGADVATQRARIYLQCPQPPALPKLRLPAGTIQPGRNTRFALAEKPKRGYTYRWEIPGDTAVESPTFRYRFPQAGHYEIRLTVTDTAQGGDYCSVDTAFTLQVGETLVRLPRLPLHYDRLLPTLVFGWGMWLLLALLAAAAAWYWLRWLRRKPLPPDAQAGPARVAEIQSGDKPPYYIPFREQKGALRTAREQYRLADAMRLRQQSDELILDLPATLRATLDRGGFPTLRFRHRTRPTEYLVLADEQMPGRHLARLFRHLAETLRGQDVQLDLVWCDAELRHFRIPGIPRGLSFEGLRRQFPQHRLVILGAAHSLLDGPRLRADAAAALQGLPQRLLLTPRPVADWDWREAALYRHFGLFPADLRGLLDAAAFVEKNLEADDMPAEFAQWKALQQELRRADASMEYRAWRTLAEYDACLEPYGPALRRWFLALAVHPAPSWEITLAIARSLDIAPTHDRLLALARLPALRDGRLHPALRRDMLRALDPDTEKTARRAVLAELEAIQHLTEGSHVAEETAAYITVQSFLLEPEEETHRAALAALLKAGKLGRPLEMELDLFVEKQLARPDPNLSAEARKKMEGRPANIRAWLEATQPEPTAPDKPRKPFFTADFRRAAALTAAALLTALLGWMACRPGSLAQRLLSDEARTPGRDPLRHFVLLKEDMQVDSALIYNNLGVLSDELLAQTGKQPSLDSLKTAVFNLRQNLTSLADYNAEVQKLYRLLDTAAVRESLQNAAPEAYPAQDALFAHARSLKKAGKDPVLGVLGTDYALARQNQARNAANQAAALLDQYRTRRDSLSLAAARFAAAAALAGADFPAERCYALHGQGVAQHYAGSRTAALALYDTLLAAGYFDTLRLRPNLETLLFGNGFCYTAAKLRSPIGFYARELQPAEQNALLADPDGPQARETLLGVIPGGSAVTVLDSSRYFWRARFQGRVGYVAKSVRNQPTLLPCDPPALDTAARIAAAIADIERNMIFVQGGRFRMGCTEEQGEDCFDREKPPHDVELSDFRIGRTEVTVAQYMAFVADTKTHYPEWLEPGSDYNIKTGNDDYYKQFGRALQADNHPIVGISWNDAVAFCDWLSKKTGVSYRLPTEAEWEYAARGGARAPEQYKYAGSNDIESVAWYDANAGGKTHPVGRKKPNDLGLYDMSGNVWEWCADWYGAYAEKSEIEVNPRGPEEGSDRVLRGGGWYHGAEDCRAAYRDSSTPTTRNRNVGFRLALQ